jgi:hydroxymethylpyrimidine/phosphomethylpyrimidine kinase
MTRVPPIALTIAGLDPSGGAGITADLKTFAAHGLYGICCVTALTVQSTQGVRRTVPVDATVIVETLDCLADDITPAGIKIGMLETAGAVHAVSDFLERANYPAENVVLDPIVRSSSGAALLDEEGISALKGRLLARVGWITPNIDELAFLLNEPVAVADEVPAQAQRLQKLASTATNSHLRVIVTGGHLADPDDFFLDVNGESGWVRGRWVKTNATHGTGCAFSSALLCQHLLQGPQSGCESKITAAKEYVTSALEHAYPIGQGKGPMNHLYKL